MLFYTFLTKKPKKIDFDPLRRFSAKIDNSLLLVPKLNLYLKSIASNAIVPLKGSNQFSLKSTNSID